MEQNASQESIFRLLKGQIVLDVAKDLQRQALELEASGDKGAALIKARAAGEVLEWVKSNP